MRVRVPPARLSSSGFLHYMWMFIEPIDSLINRSIDWFNVKPTCRLKQVIFNPALEFQGEFDTNPVLRSYFTASAVRLVFLQPAYTTPLLSYYAIGHLSIRGHCQCFGHASTCSGEVSLPVRYFRRFAAQRIIEVSIEKYFSAVQFWLLALQHGIVILIHYIVVWYRHSAEAWITLLFLLDVAGYRSI